MNKPHVLFLCAGNSARSQMAEGLLRALAGEQFEVFSAGTEPKNGILPEVQEAMREIGIDVSGQRPKSVTEYLGKKVFAHVITVCLRTRYHRLRGRGGELSRSLPQHGDAR